MSAAKKVELTINDIYPSDIDHRKPTSDNYLKQFNFDTLENELLVSKEQGIETQPDVNYNQDYYNVGCKQEVVT